jgi:hypothetical protein
MASTQNDAAFPTAVYIEICTQRDLEKAFVELKTTREVDKFPWNAKEVALHMVEHLPALQFIISSEAVPGDVVLTPQGKTEVLALAGTRPPAFESAKWLHGSGQEARNANQSVCGESRMQMIKSGYCPKSRDKNDSE